MFGLAVCFIREVLGGFLVMVGRGGFYVVVFVFGVECCLFGDFC